MKNIWKGLIGLFVLLLGFVLWIVGSIVEGLAGWGGESFLITRGAMGIGFLLIFFGPIFFWIILPLKDRWYGSHPKRFIAAITPFVLFILLISAVAIPEVVHMPQLPTYSFNATIEGDKIVVGINRITEGDLSDDLSLKLIDPDGKIVDSDRVSNQDIKDGEEKGELKLSYFGTHKSGNYTLIIKNTRDETIYREEIEVVPSKYSFSISTVDEEVHLTIKKTEAGPIPDALKVALDEKGGTFSWWDAQEVEIIDEKTLTLNPKYEIGDFSKEYLVKVKNIDSDVIFNETTVLKPKSIKLGDSIIVKDIRITPISASYTEYNPKFNAPYYREHPVEAKEGYNFLVIELTGKNIGIQESFVNSHDATLKTTKGYLYHAYNYPSIVARFVDLLPDEEKTDYLVFEIPRDQRGVAMYFKIGDEERVLQLQ